MTDIGFTLQIIYIDRDPQNKDAKKFAHLVRHHPSISVYEPKIYHIRTIQRALEWLKNNPPPKMDGVCIICWDIGFPGANEAFIEESLQSLYRLGIDRDCVIAMASSNQTDLLWSVLKTKLGADRVLSKQDVHNIGVLNLSDSISSALSRRTSSPEKIVQLSLLDMEGRVESLAQQIRHHESTLDIALHRHLKSSDIVQNLLDEIEAIHRQIETIEGTLFPAKDFSGAPSVVTLINSLRGMVASHDKELTKLDQDIGKLADLVEMRRNHLEEETIDQFAVMAAKVEALERIMDESNKSHRNALAIARQEFLYTTLGRITLVIVGVLALILISLIAPNAIGLLEGLIKALLN